MLFKPVLLIAMMAMLFPFASEGSVPRWVKLNRSPVCFGAKGNQYGRFSYPGNVFVSSFMFVHRSGLVSCAKSHRHLYSYWGCAPNSARLEAILTDDNNKILVPEASKVNKLGKYNLAGYTSSSPVLLFPVSKKAHCVHANSELRLWHGEDLVGSTESDNGGRSCADVYGLLA